MRTYLNNFLKVSVQMDILWVVVRTCAKKTRAPLFSITLGLPAVVPLSFYYYYCARISCSQMPLLNFGTVGAIEQYCLTTTKGPK